MARTIAEIYNAVCISKASMQELSSWVVDQSNPGSTLDNAETLLQDLTSSSKVAFWRVWLFIFAVASWIVETLFDTNKQEVSDLLATKQPMTLRWYSEESKKFQFGYAMIWLDNAFSYSTVDPSAQIVKYAAASEKNGQVILKVANEVNGQKVPLTLVQKVTLTAFWDKWRPAGVKLSIISLPADSMKVTMTIIRDRLVLAGDNSLLNNSSVFPINDAIKAFGDSLEFDGILRVSKLVDAIQAAQGVVDVKLVSAYVKPAGGTYVAVDMFTEAASGYFTMSWSESVVNYIDNVNVVIQS